MFAVLSDTVKDSVKLLPFLFLTYLLMEELEHRTGAKARERIRTAGKTGPVWGALSGLAPQCGFSAAAASLYAGRVITLGTLCAVFLSTSDEMLPILISEALSVRTIGKILVCKAGIAMISGFLIEFLYTVVLKGKEKEIDIHTVCEEAGCHCEEGVFRSAVKHTAKIFLYLFLLSLVLNVLIFLLGDEMLAGVFSGVPVAGEVIAALVGMIPNCASSVVITKLYLDGMIGAGAMMAGLLTNAGVGLLVLFRMNKNWKENAGIAAVIYGTGVFWGILVELANITF